MSNLRKTIQINPNLFKIGGKSRKNKGEKGKGPTVKPIISPNLLKNKLLKRIKDHKQQSSEEKQQAEYTDEFNDSLEYLKSLTVQKKQMNLKKRRFVTIFICKHRQHYLKIINQNLFNI